LRHGLVEALALNLASFKNLLDNGAPPSAPETIQVKEALSTSIIAALQAHLSFDLPPYLTQISDSIKALDITTLIPTPARSIHKINTSAANLLTPAASSSLLATRELQQVLLELCMDMATPSEHAMPVLQFSQIETAISKVIALGSLRLPESFKPLVTKVRDRAALYNTNAFRGVARDFMAAVTAAILPVEGAPRKAASGLESQRHLVLQHTGLMDPDTRTAIDDIATGLLNLVTGSDTAGEELAGFKYLSTAIVQLTKHTNTELWNDFVGLACDPKELMNYITAVQSEQDTAFGASKDWQCFCIS
jgi:hypothetical protein